MVVAKNPLPRETRRELTVQMTRDKVRKVLAVEENENARLRRELEGIGEKAFIVLLLLEARNYTVSRIHGVGTV